MYQLSAQLSVLHQNKSPFEILQHICEYNMQHFESYSLNHPYLLIQNQDYWDCMQNTMHYLVVAGYPEEEVYAGIDSLSCYHSTEERSALEYKKERCIQRDLKRVYALYCHRYATIHSWILGVWTSLLYSLLGWGTLFYFP